jgi:hypothetical protein
MLIRKNRYGELRLYIAFYIFYFTKKKKRLTFTLKQNFSSRQILFVCLSAHFCATSCLLTLNKGRRKGLEAAQETTKQIQIVFKDTENSSKISPPTVALPVCIICRESKGGPGY